VKRTASTRRRRLLLGPLTAALLALAGAPGALADGAAWWQLDATPAPTLLPRTGEAQLIVTATNLGDSTVNAGEGHPVTLTDLLPAGLTPISVEGETGHGIPGHQQGETLACAHDASTVSCTFADVLPASEHLYMRVILNVEDPTGAPLAQNTVTIQGGLGENGQEPASQALHKPLALQTVPGQATPFGVETYALRPETATGAPDTQASSHPFQLTTTLDLDQTLAAYAKPSAEEGVFPSAAALPRTLHFRLPAGLLGDPDAVPTCSDADFATEAFEKTNLCPGDTAVGVATVLFNEPRTFGLSDEAVPVFNLQPAPGEPARFGFEIENVPVVLRTSLPTGGEYAVVVTVENASQAAQVLASQVTLWGVPGDASHDRQRGWECLSNGAWDLGAEPAKPCQPQDDQSPTAFLTLPSSCAAPPASGVSGESWGAGLSLPAQHIAEGDPNTIFTFPTAPTGCGGLEFNPSLALSPEMTQGSTPTGLQATVTMPQQGLTDPEQNAEPALKDTTVTLPEGLQLNPSAANALQTCSALQFGFAFAVAAETEQVANERFEPGSPQCPDAAKVGTVTASTPLLADELTGSLYLAAEHTNPFQSPLVLYLVAEDPKAGVLFKLAGTVTVLESGQLITTFQNTPQASLFRTLKLHFFGGERASLSTPAKCGSYAVVASFTGWSGQTATPSSEPAFQVVSGPGGGPCTPQGSPLPFGPSFTAGVANPQAGALTPFTVTVGHADSDQPLERVNVRLPAGIAALIANVTPCPEAQALANACGSASLIGHTSAVAGLGAEPVTLPGQLYLTGPLRATSTHGASPFGLLAVTHAAAGPFDLGDVSVLSTLNVDSSTAAVTVQSEPIPRLIKGVPADLKQLTVIVERPGNAPFAFNPTDCDPLSIGAGLTGYEGASVGLSYPFQVQGCGGLPFRPVFSAATGGRASKADGASLVVRVVSAGLGQAGIAKTTVTLPKALPSRLTTIQKACVAAVFEADPASCPEGSNVGSATIHTPIFTNPLSGPAYLVSHGGAAFPDVEFVLQGEGVTLILDGATRIKKGVTTASFEAVPDAPFTSFETSFPTGPHSALTANVAEKKKFDLCGEKLVMPTVITAQNGRVIEQPTKIAIEGCAAVKSAKARKLTRVERLTLALRVCRKRYKHAKAGRVECERQARRKYAAVKKAAHRKSKPGTAGSGRKDR
jgi:uncharacterized repeat protein (TIGR01451 family)